MRGSWALCILLVLGARARAWAEEVTVFAAASLTEAMTDVSDAYRASSGKRVRFSFAASSVLARQIEAGAPADIFASANESWMDYLDARGLIDASRLLEEREGARAILLVTDAETSSFGDTPKLWGELARVRPIIFSVHIGALLEPLRSRQRMQDWAASGGGHAHGDRLRRRDRRRLGRGRGRAPVGRRSSRRHSR